jgi:hypothetical protein
VTKIDKAADWLSNAKVIAAVVVAVMTLIATAVGGVFWLGANYRDIVREVIREAMADDLAELREDIAAEISGASIVSFIGAGMVPDRGPYIAGGVVPVAYIVRRTRDCPTDVIVRYFSARIGTVDTSLTSRIEATRSAPSAQFSAFTVQARLPSHTRPGIYSYAPVLEAHCEEGTYRIPVPLSEFFEVSSLPEPIISGE